MKTADELKNFFIVRYGQKNWSMQVQDTNAIIPLLWARRHGCSKPIPFYEVSKDRRERIKDPYLWATDSACIRPPLLSHKLPSTR